MKSSQNGQQYHVESTYNNDGGTRIMSYALVGLIVLTGGVFAYNTFAPKPVPRPAVVEGQPDIRMTLADGPVVAYIKEWAGSRNRTEARKYARTTAVLGQCGIMYRTASKGYVAENEANFNILKTRIVPGGSQPQKTSKQVASNEINADMFKFEISTTSGNSMLAATAMAQELANPYPEEAYKKRPSKEECNEVKKMAQDGDLVVRI